MLTQAAQAHYRNADVTLRGVVLQTVIYKGLYDV